MTDWEAGQDLIIISDTIGEKLKELKISHPKLYYMLDDVQRTIGDHFNELRSHDFGLKSHHEEKGIERCNGCGKSDFAVARDMKATRHCSCGNIWLPK